jgi:hypothetical protein
MSAKSALFAAWLGTAAVVVHGIPLVLHSMAHMQLGIYLSSVVANVYIGVVLFAAPVVAVALLWARWTRSGAWLLALSMLGSLIFEVYNHFMAMSPDHVSQVPASTWGEVFRMTAVASAITEVLGLAAGVFILMRPQAPSPAAAEGAPRA